MRNKNYSQWKVLHYSWDNLDDFKARWNRLPGIHTINFDEGQSPIDIYVNENVKYEGFTAQPVFFTGAVSKRENKKGPFFSGLGITHNKKIPLIAIADPCLDSDTSLSLAWYVGGPNDAFTKNLTVLLTVLQENLDRELIFVGGSGGGYAALNTASQFDGNASVLVWNPQTDIYEYAERFVKEFLRSQFNFSFAALGAPNWKEYCKIRTDSKINTNVLTAETILKPRRLVYLQNSGDWHREKHLKPLWEKVSSEPIIEGQNSLDEDRIAFVQKFAEGHAPPSSTLIADLLYQLMDTKLHVRDLAFKY